MAEFLINSDTVLNKLLKSLLKTYYLFVKDGFINSEIQWQSF